MEPLPLLSSVRETRQESSSLGPPGRHLHCVCVCVRTAGELLSVAEQFLEQQMHPTVIIGAYRRALDDMLDTLKEIRYAALIGLVLGLE